MNETIVLNEDDGTVTMDLEVYDNLVAGRDFLRNSLKELLEAIKYHHADDYVQIKYGRIVMGAYKALEQTIKGDE